MKQKYEEELKRAVHEKREIQNVITQKKNVADHCCWVKNWIQKYRVI